METEVETHEKQDGSNWVPLAMLCNTSASFLMASTGVSTCPKRPHQAGLCRSNGAEVMDDPWPFQSETQARSHKPRYCYSYQYLTLSFRKFQMSVGQNQLPPDFAHLKRLIYPFLVIVCLDCALHKYSKCTKVYRCISCTSVHMFVTMYDSSGT